MTHNHVNKDICVNDTVTYMKEIRNYKIKKPQYLESSGYIRIYEQNGLTITRAIVSGFKYMKEITPIIKLIVGQDNEPLHHIIIDTSLCNQYTEGDIEPGTQKIIKDHCSSDSDHDSSDSDHDSSDSDHYRSNKR